MENNKKFTVIKKQILVFVFLVFYFGWNVYQITEKPLSEQTKTNLEIFKLFMLFVLFVILVLFSYHLYKDVKNRKV